MRISATQHKVEALALLLGLLLEEAPANPAEWLLQSHVRRVYTRLRAKTERLLTGKEGWGMTLSMEEAISLQLYCHNRALPLQAYRYECLQLQIVLDQVDKEITACLSRQNAGSPKTLPAGYSSKLLNGL